jgi:hypothetical protein
LDLKSTALVVKEIPQLVRTIDLDVIQPDFSPFHLGHHVGDFMAIVKVIKNALLVLSLLTQ